MGWPPPDSISGLSAGMQTIQITDSLGCVVVDSVVVAADTVWQDYNITALDSISCYQADDGEITVSGTTTGLTFLWNDGSTDTNRTGLAPAAYELVIGNGAGCRDTLAAVLNEPTDLIASWATTPASCVEIGAVPSLLMVQEVRNIAICDGFGGCECWTARRPKHGRILPQHSRCQRMYC